MMWTGLCTAWLAACATEPLPIRNLAKGGVSGIIESRQLVVTNAADWTQWWTTHRANTRGDTAPPEIDFTKEMVVLFALGQQRTGGYSVEIVKVQPEEKSLKIYVKRKSPPKGAMVTQALTAPFHFVAVPRSELKPEFVEGDDPGKK